MNAEQLLSGELGVQYMLVLARISGLFLIAPVFSSRMIPVRAKLLLALGLSLAALPMVATETTRSYSVPQLAVAAVQEVLIGLVIGFSAAVAFAAIGYAGGLIDMQSGFSFASVLDPINNMQTAVVGQTFQLLASIVFVAIGGPLILVATVVRSFQVIPQQSTMAVDVIAKNASSELGYILSAGLVLAAPIVVTLLVTDIAVGFLSRVVPQMNIFSVELPVKILVTLVMLMLLAPLLIFQMGEIMQDALSRTTQLLLG